MWFQYVVGYDKNEQRSLITSLRKELIDFQRQFVAKFDQARSASPFVIKPVAIALVSVAAFVSFVFLTRRVRRFGWRHGLEVWRTASESESSRVDFYERFVKLLAKRGLTREAYQTPREFAATLRSAEAELVTWAYNRVRFGSQMLSDGDRRRLEQALTQLEQNYQ